MNRLIALLVLAATATAVRADQWKLVWSDEFNEPGLPNPDKWGYETGFVRNNEAQYYTRARKENARVENGKLIIEARKEHWPSSSVAPAKKARGRSRRGGAANYTSASLTTQGKAAWTYGRIDVRAKLPGGRGTWPAIWCLGTNITQVGWPACGEIDIMEHVGFEPGVIHATVHTNTREKRGHVSKGGKTPCPDAAEAFHVYRVDWDARKMDFYLDGQKYFTYGKEGNAAAAWPFDKEQYLILNLAIGGAWGGQKGVDDSIFPRSYVIDYVRVYQKPQPK
ncbi:MAG: glycoside hydrolase family 16 protein [Isosphaeraceae bacterium]